MPCRLPSIVVSTGQIPASALLNHPLEQRPERAEVEVEVLVREPELRLQLLHPLREPHEREPETLDLLVVECALLHPPQRLPLHQLPQELDERQHELGEAALDALRIGVHSPWERIRAVGELAREPVDVAARRD